jgi:hypothetical protein
VQELLTTDPKSISLGHPAFKYVWEVLQAMMQPCKPTAGSAK